MKSESHKTYPRSEATVASILDAAAALFVAKNYRDVTMDQIAEACNVTKGALYHHFASKEELYLELMNRRLQARKEMFSEAIGTGGPCRNRLRRLTAAFFDLPTTEREVIKLVRRDINIFEEPARGRLVREYQASLPELVERVIRDGIRDGELAQTDPRLLSWQFVAMVEVTLNDYSDRLFPSPQEKLDYVMDLFFEGTAVKPQGATE